MAVIRFEPNVPVELALKYDGGKRVQSRIPEAPDQMMYTICGDDTIYVPLHVGEQITQLGIKRAELFSICKLVRNKTTTWEVKRLGDAAEPPTPPPAPTAFDRIPTEINATPIERQLTASINQAREQKAQRAVSQATPATQSDESAPPKQQQSAQAHSPNVTPCNIPQGQTRASYALAASLISAIDAVRLAEDYARSKGVEVVPLKVEFIAEDLRAIAATAYIQACKDPLFAERMPVASATSPNTPAKAVNGGASWRQ